MFILAGALFVASAVSSDGADLRPGRYEDLADLASDRSDKIADLNAQAAALQEEVNKLTEQLGGNELPETQQRLNQAKGPAGLLPVKGPGVTVTLDDAPAPVLDNGEGDTNLKLVHEQDIQAVVNSLWAGGAEAITLQGQRITSSSGIKCVGNSVLLHGVAYPPPYVISAIGSQDMLIKRLMSDPVVQVYLRDAEIYGLGFDARLDDNLEFPAFAGSIETRYAQVPIA